MARIFITGSSQGLGRASAEALIASGHDVLLHARNAARAEDLRPLASHADGVLIGDLTRAEDIRRLAERLEKESPLDAVIHNAGMYLDTERMATVDGHSRILAVNLLAPYLLTALIPRPRRLVFIGSDMQAGSAADLDDVDWTRRTWDSTRAYGESKLQVAALASHLARKWTRTVSSTVDPGWVATRMGGRGAPGSIEDGHATQTWLATSSDTAAHVSGGYWRRMKRVQPPTLASDPAYQERLIEELSQLTGITIPT